MDTGVGRSLGDYLGFLRRQWILVVVAVVVAAVLSLLLAQSLPSTYSATASVLVERAGIPATDAEDARTVSDVNMDTEAQVVRSMPVAETVQDEIGSSRSTRDLLESVAVSVPANTTILAISFSAASPDEAAVGAQAFAEAYLDYRVESAARDLSSKVDALEGQAAVVQTQIRDLMDTLRNSKGERRRSILEGRLSLMRARAAAIDEQLLPLSTLTSDAGSVIDSATPPTAPTSPDRLLLMATGTALLSGLGVALAWWRDRRLDVIRLPQDIETGCGLDVIGLVSQSSLSDASLQPYRQLAHAVRARTGLSGGSVLIVGVGERDVAGDVALSLSRTVTRTGSPVELVYSTEAAADAAREAAGADVDRFDVSSLESRALVVEGDVQDAGLRDFVRETSGGKASRQTFLAPPPTGTSADAQAIGPLADLTLLVVQLGASSHESVLDAVRQLRQVGTRSLVALALLEQGSSRRARAAAARSLTRAAAARPAGAATTGVPVPPATGSPPAPPRTTKRATASTKKRTPSSRASKRTPPAGGATASQAESPEPSGPKDTSREPDSQHDAG